MKLKTVFVVQHLRSEEDSEDWKMVGVYTSEAEAEVAIERKRQFPGFCRFPRIVDPMDDDENESGFHISECELNRDLWSEGFGI